MISSGCLDFLDEGFYEATIYSDAEHSDWQFNPSSYNISQEIVSKNDMINIKLNI